MSVGILELLLLKVSLWPPTFSIHPKSPAACARFSASNFFTERHFLSATQATHRLTDPDGPGGHWILKIRCSPESVDTISDSSFTFRAKLASSKAFCILANQKLSIELRTPPLQISIPHPIEIKQNSRALVAAATQHNPTQGRRTCRV